MSTFLQLEAVLGPALIAWLLLRRYVPERSVGSTIELMGTAAAIGLGSTSIIFFFWRFTGMQPRFYAAFDIGLQALLICAIVYTRRRPANPTGPAVDAIEPEPLRMLAGAIAAAAFCLGAMLLAHSFTELPHGWSDGWAVWNLRAAFLSVPDDHWRDGFTSALAWSHPDYPLLVPASVARLWSVGDTASPFAPRLFVTAVVASAALALAGSVARHAGIIAMSLALSLLLIPSYLNWGASQTADVPLGLYVLIAVTALSTPSAGSRHAIGGLATGFATWTKNEGVVVAAAVVVVLAAMALRSRRDGRRLAQFAIGLAVGGITLLLFKLVLAPPSDLMHQILTQQPLEKATDASRHIFVARYMVRESFTWGNWFLVSPSVLLLVCAAMAGFRWRAVPGQVAIGGSVVALMVAGYYWVYVLSPYDLEWHLSTSWSRLVAQVWPTLVWTVVVAGLSPWKGSRGEFHDKPPSAQSSPRPPSRWR